MADADALGEDHTSFIQFEGMPVLSRAALQLHAAAIASSIEDGQPGFVSDYYLNAIAAETTTAALELEAAGMWERRDSGYLIVAGEMVKIAIGFHERTDRQGAECARRGEHLPSGDGRKSGGWVICGHCGIPLEHPDGGPVALPAGGPLGPAPARRNRDHPPIQPGREVTHFHVCGTTVRPCSGQAAPVTQPALPLPGRDPNRCFLR